ncbi:MAG: PBECR2 nuclease fold domain-containing protein [Ruminococcus sp.]|nr:PBECR2 nuclease fold domain-containing protein [Ruminococcus sp.]
MLRLPNNRSFAAPKTSGRIFYNKRAKAEKDVKIIGRLNIEIFKCIDSGIISDEVIITEERIQHIKERHPNDYERYCLYMKEVVENPEYIIEANKPRSALILKSFSEGNEQFKTVLRLVTPEDNKDFKNSVITFMKINEKEWNRLIKNKKILYKSE